MTPSIPAKEHGARDRNVSHQRIYKLLQLAILRFPLPLLITSTYLWINRKNTMYLLMVLRCAYFLTMTSNHL